MESDQKSQEFNQKQLKTLINVCRKGGVKKFTGFGVTLELGDEPAKPRAALKEVPIETPDKYTDEDVLFWSSGGVA